ncbi:D-alanyl-D-alanine carboxypeptidase family protein [Paenibacillus physcomitrellae]|uniref:D-alanyl-D-alanine carboxypeptidase DacB n=1 Tax=Paenibacillus physcomitrellae TaxID=1619311 RepID=A0ABQ1FNY4_9BACL|nr:D-alanyl-D-alanine carboxypeptidase family protein [Paenibacillus physcomitrellae]GGA22802.1 D-alanyl-D-alanine carboxypeptidase DacB [Paenibacillus physcomitrellae]
MKRLKRKISWLGLMLLTCLLLQPVGVRAQEETKGPPEVGTHAQAAALIDVESGRLLYSKQGDEILPIASLTKIMTAIVAIENGGLDKKVKVSAKAFGKEGSSIYLKLGEEMTLENMLYGLMLRSGNDAATAIAEHVGGSEEGFVHLMNQKAEMIGLKHTHFMNPHGLDHKQHYSTANDLAKLTAYALHNPVFKQIVSTKQKKAPNPNESWGYDWLNKNKMLRMYEGADGVKTGFTKIARRCLVSSATRNGQQLAAVTLNDGDDWNDHANMLDFGFANFPLQTLVNKQQPIKHEGMDLTAGIDFQYPLHASEKQQVQQEIKVMESRDPFGFRGKLVLKLNGEIIGSVPLYENKQIEQQKGKGHSSN